MDQQALVTQPRRLTKAELFAWIRTHRNAHLWLALLGCGSLIRYRFSPRQRDKLASLVMWASGTGGLGNAFVIDKLLQLGGFSVRVEPALVRATPHEELAWEAFVTSQRYEGPWLAWHVGAARRIQRRWREWTGRRDAAARRIQRACVPWLTKPVTADGKLGISLRILVGMGGRPGA